MKETEMLMDCNCDLRYYAHVKRFSELQRNGIYFASEEEADRPIGFSLGLLGVSFGVPETRSYLADTRRLRDRLE